MTAKKIKKTTQSVQKKTAKKQAKKSVVKRGQKNNRDNQIIIEIVDRLIEGQTADTVTEWLINEGYSAPTASELIDKAATEIGDTANTDLRQEVATAKRRLDVIYAAAIKAGNLTIALRTVDLRTRLLSVSDAAPAWAGGAGGAENADAAAVREILESLNWCKTGLPLPELTRQVVTRIVTQF